VRPGIYSPAPPKPASTSSTTFSPGPQFT
jgi:hypothetical protein